MTTAPSTILDHLAMNSRRFSRVSPFSSTPSPTTRGSFSSVMVPLTSRWAISRYRSSIPLGHIGKILLYRNKLSAGCQSKSADPVSKTDPYGAMTESCGSTIAAT